MSQKRHVKNVLPFTVFPKGRIGSSLTRSCILRSVWKLSWIVWRHLAVSVECMFVSLGFWVSGGVFQLIWVIFWDARAAWGCSRVFLETLFMKDSVRLELTHQLGPTLKGKILFTWRFWDIKISKPDYLPLPKMIAFCHFSCFSCLSEKYYNLQCLWITL